MLSAVAFEPLKEGVRTRTEALYVLGFPADTQPDPRALKARYRMLAMIFHPDSPQGDTLRMGQLNAARNLLRL
jgi:curved DNA-binding protein CbpA